MSQKIRIYPDKVLRAETLRIEMFNNELLRQTENLVKILEENNNAVGLAAPQLGISKKFFGIKGENKKVTVFVNPEILKTFGKWEFPKIVREKESLKGVNKATEDFLEGCLSFPNYFGTVKRFLKIEVGWQMVGRKKLINKKKIIEGFEAIVFQHELDHLNGILLIDRVKESMGKFYKVMGEKMELVKVRDLGE